MKRIGIVLSVFLVLAGCAAKKTEVSKPLDADRKLKASQRPYTVNGKRYEPLQSHEGFIQSGVASWYGRDFHGKTTSNGERYDMNAMTAAHKTLPLGVYVKVHNRDNGKDAVVRVNDRGPFVKGRIIDLSYAAAKKIGMDGIGTAPVEIVALGYREDGKGGYQPPDTYDTGNYAVQVGAFKEYANAQRLSDELKHIYGFSGIKMANINGETFYRVYAGKYSSLKAAEAAERNFVEHGYPGSFVVALD